MMIHKSRKVKKVIKMKKWDGYDIFVMVGLSIVSVILLVFLIISLHKESERRAIVYEKERTILDKRNETIISIIGDHKYRVTDSTLNEWNYYITDSITGDVYYLIYDEASDSYRYEEVEIGDEKKQENREYKENHDSVIMPMPIIIP